MAGDWNHFCQNLLIDRELGFSLDLSRVSFPEGYVDGLRPSLDAAFAAMQQLEAGSVANPDEDRMVGHYWLRDASLAPTPELRDEIASTYESIVDFVRGVRTGDVRGQGGPFEHFLLVGIGGSALGPQFVADALGSPDDALVPHFFDNTDPDGFDRTLQPLRDSLDRTLVVVISKSGGTPETRNGMLEAQRAYKEAGVPFGQHAVAVTQVGSKLDSVAREEGWLARFPMWDWVGGRTSVTSAVGLVPAGLQGVDLGEFLGGAARMDALTRQPDLARNPAALLALAWHYCTGGKGEKDMVILPYKDRLLLFSRYLQQLVMESLGKELDRKGNTVHQGIAVYGNKGSTDQHAYVQQLRDGVENFFVTFLEVLRDRDGESLEVEPGVTSGDYLAGFLQGTREALADRGRDTITITIEEVSAATVGMLIALYERAVGLYAELIDINAYHQPGVEAGKMAAKTVLDLQQQAVAALRDAGKPSTAMELAEKLGRPQAAESIYKTLGHLAANVGRGVAVEATDSPATTTFRAVGSIQDRLQP